MKASKRPKQYSLWILGEHEFAGRSRKWKLRVDGKWPLSFARVFVERAAARGTSMEIRDGRRVVKRTLAVVPFQPTKEVAQ
jgi:hypothetical protein